MRYLLLAASSLHTENDDIFVLTKTPSFGIPVLQNSWRISPYELMILELFIKLWQKIFKIVRNLGYFFVWSTQFALNRFPWPQSFLHLISAGWSYTLHLVRNFGLKDKYRKAIFIKMRKSNSTMAYDIRFMVLSNKDTAHAILTPTAQLKFETECTPSTRDLESSLCRFSVVHQQLVSYENKSGNQQGSTMLFKLMHLNLIVPQSRCVGWRWLWRKPYFQDLVLDDSYSYSNEVVEHDGLVPGQNLSIEYNYAASYLQYIMWKNSFCPKTIHQTGSTLFGLGQPEYAFERRFSTPRAISKNYLLNVSHIPGT